MSESPRSPASSTAEPRSSTDRRVLTFVALLVALAAMFVAVSSAASIDIVALAPVYMFTPLVATLVVSRRFEVPLSSIGLTRTVNRWSAIAWLVPVPIVVVVLLVSLGLPESSFVPNPAEAAGVADSETAQVIPTGWPGVLVVLGLGLLAGATINAVLAFGEELGWRGYLLTELRHLGFWRASVAIGALWGVWHAPIVAAGYNYPTNPTLGVGAMTLFCVLFAPIFTYVTVRARSVLAPSLAHGTLNGVGGVTIVFTAGYSEFVVGLLGLVGMAVLLGVNVLLFVSGTPSLEGLWAEGSTYDDIGEREPATADA